MFRGINALTLDAKGRLAMPAKYRETLTQACQGRLVATIDTEESCLLIYPEPQWQEIQAKVEALPSFNKAARRMQRLLIGYASDLEMDGNGRMLIPTLLREYAHLEKPVILLGQGKKFELWNEALWQQRRDAWLQDSMDSEEALPSDLESLSL